MELQSIYKALNAIKGFLLCPKCGHDILSDIVPMIPQGASNPTVPETPTGTPAKVFPHKITFERESDEGYGNVAIVLFKTLADAEVTKVSVNGEAATKRHPYHGHPVFSLTHTGDQYAKPLRFSITCNGVDYVAEQSPVAEPTAPSGANSETVSSKGEYANGNRTHFRFSHPGSYYGLNVRVWIDGVEHPTIPDASQRKEWPDGFLCKPKSDNNGKLVILGRRGVRSNSCTIKW